MPQGPRFVRIGLGLGPPLLPRDARSGNEAGFENNPEVNENDPISRYSLSGSATGGIMRRSRSVEIFAAAMEVGLSA
jgi:hypothetical protein